MNSQHPVHHIVKTSWNAEIAHCPAVFEIHQESLHQDVRELRSWQSGQIGVCAVIISPISLTSLTSTSERMRATRNSFVRMFALYLAI
jgi:hypothetical protein